MEQLQTENEDAGGQSRSTVGLGIAPVAWRRTDTARTVITENEETMRGWELDGLFFEALVPKDIADVWQNEAAAVMARFINLSDHPDSDAWGETAIVATRLLNMPNAKVSGGGAFPPSA